MSVQAKINELRLKKRQIADRVKDSKSVDEIRAAGIQVDALNSEIDELIDRMAGEYDDIPAGGLSPEEMEARGYRRVDGSQQQRSASSGISAGRIIASYGMGNGAGSMDARGNMGPSREMLEQRGAALKNRRAVEFGLDELTEFRAVSIGSSNLVVPTHTANRLNPAFNEVSSIIDVVYAPQFVGGNQYSKGFVTGYGEGGYTTETADYTDADPTMDYVDIGKAKITAYSELSDEAAKLPDIMYQEEIRRGIEIALRKKIAKQIIAGAGGSNAITGIFNAPAKVIPTASDISVSAIDGDTLDTIVFGYGGSEDVEGGAYLFLNKLDLAEFAKQRDANGMKKLYTITLDQNGNTGTISSDQSYSVRFIINSQCPALSASGTASTTYCMAYGKPMAYEMPLFSPIEVEESRDFKFKSGQIAYRGSVWVGGNVAAYKGFARIKKG